VLNGLFLVVLGLIWPRMVLSRVQEKTLTILATACVYINYFQALWGAYFGRSRPTTLFPQDRLPFPFEKTTLDIVLAGMSIGFMIVCAMTVYGLYRGLAAQRNAGAAAPARPAAV
jgi:hydroxylaminobenzene mutase